MCRTLTLFPRATRWPPHPNPPPAPRLCPCILPLHQVIKCRIENWIGPALTTHLLQLLKFFLLLIYFCHWNACIWWLIGQPAYDEVDGVEMHWTKVVHTKFIYGEQGELVRCVCASAPPPFGRQVARTGRGQRRF